MVGRRGNLKPGDPVLSEILHRLVQAFQPERIYLFGSKGRRAGKRSASRLLHYRWEFRGTGKVSDAKD